MSWKDQNLDNSQIIRRQNILENQLITRSISPYGEKTACTTVLRVTPHVSLDVADYCFAHSIRVRFAETDAMGIVHHSRYLPYLEEARVAYLRSIGHPYSENRDAGRDFAVHECQVRYQVPLRFDEIVTVHLQPVQASGATFTIDYLLTVDGKVTTRARTIHAYVDTAGRPHRLPGWIKELVTK